MASPKTPKTLDLTPLSHRNQALENANNRKAAARSGVADGINDASEQTNRSANAVKLAENQAGRTPEDPSTTQQVLDTTNQLSGALQGKFKGAGIVSGIGQMVSGLNKIKDAFGADSSNLDPKAKMDKIMAGMSEFVQGTGELIPGKYGNMVESIGQNMTKVKEIVENPNLTDAQKYTEVAKSIGSVVVSTAVGVLGGDALAAVTVVADDIKKDQLGTGTLGRIAEATAVGQLATSVNRNIQESSRIVDETNKTNEELLNQYNETNIKPEAYEKARNTPEAKQNIDHYKTLSSASMMIPANERLVQSNNFNGMKNGEDPNFLREKLTELKDKAGKEAESWRPEFLKTASLGYVPSQAEVDYKRYDKALKELDEYEKNGNSYLAANKIDDKTKNIAKNEEPKQEQDPEKARLEAITKDPKVASATTNLRQSGVEHKEPASDKPSHNLEGQKVAQTKVTEQGRV